MSVQLSKRLMIMGALSLVLLVSLWSARMNRNKRKNTQALPRLISEPLSQAGFIDKQRAQKTRPKPAYGRNPFSESDYLEQKMKQAATLSPKESSFLTLTGILKRGDKRVAIINRMFVREGDLIQGAKVLQIEGNQVVLRQDHQEIILRMKTA